MSRLLVRRCSMSSIEEEDETTTSDEITIQPEKLPSSSLQHYQPFYHSPSVPDWDSELSESEQEFDDNDEDPNENGEERAANRALQNFMQTCSRTVCIANIVILTHISQMICNRIIFIKVM